MRGGELWRRCVQALTGYGHSVVAEDCAAYLSGSYVEHVERSGLPIPVPSWAWLNGVTHGSLEDIDGLAGDRDKLLHRVFFGWRECRTVIAAELRDLAGEDVRLLASIQRDVLLPLEDGMFATGSHHPVATAQRVLEAMREYVAAVDNGV